MADSLPYMLFYPGDFLRSTRGWSVTAKGVYRELLDVQWDLGKLPTDPEELRMIIGATAAEWTAGWRRCECKFPIVDGGRMNLRCEEHRKAALAARDARHRKSQVAAASRWAKHDATTSTEDAPSIASGIAQSTPQAVLEDCPPTPTPTPTPAPTPAPETESEKRPRKRGTRLPDDWQPSPEDVTFATTRRLSVADTALKFRNYWIAKAGRDAVKLDWSKTWQNWCITEAERRPGNGAARKPEREPTPDEIAASRRRAAEENRATAERLGLAPLQSGVPKAIPLPNLRMGRSQ